MIEHSKRPELRYDDHYARIYDDVTGMILADLYRLNRHASREAATQELHVLGRKMAASPELVERLRRLVSLARLAEDALRRHGEEPLAHDIKEQCAAAWVDLEKAGVKP